MFYRPEDGHGLPHNPWNAIIAPRPIAWISTRSTLGDNLAPYSFFSACAYSPPQLMFASTSTKPDRDTGKDTLAQIRETGVFCVNLVTPALTAPMNASSAPLAAGVSEFDVAGLTPAECETIACPRVAEAPASIECRMTQIVKLEGTANYLCTGVAVGIHIRPDCLVDGRYSPQDGYLARMGYQDYAAVRDVFELERPE
ncbi:flavin reductase family protein [Albirhodobacter sp. R86504]|jgi:flavin reductase (DIM6/NTAB) family NADH-FMN oxidoreductase RutF|uniref:flavin reductase family protein n=1 Tax=Albirhodobacter sp. R86504 TaxID=3093848 RepID=UPI00366AA027